MSEHRLEPWTPGDVRSEANPSTDAELVGELARVFGACLDRLTMYGVIADREYIDTTEDDEERIELDTARAENLSRACALASSLQMLTGEFVDGPEHPSAGVLISPDDESTFAVGLEQVALNLTRQAIGALAAAAVA